MSEDPNSLEEDIYAFFNLRKNATKDDINAAYRRLSRIYHPDKHTNPERKGNAERIFNKIRKYHSILIDDRKRQLYDLSGGKEIDTLSDMQICEVDPFTGRPMTAAQIREEYERLMKKAQEEDFIEKTNPRGHVTVTVNACDLFRPGIAFGYGDEFYGESRYAELRSISIGQSVEAPLGPRDKLTVGGRLSARSNGLGSGNVSLVLQRRLRNSCWSEADLTIGDEMSIGFKLHGSVLNKIYGIGRVSLGFSDYGILPTFLVGAERPLDKHLTGSITASLTVDPRSSDWASALHNPSVSTALTFDDNFAKRLSSFLVIGIHDSYIGFAASYKLRGSNAKLRTSLRFGTDGINGQLGYEKQASEHSTLGCTLSVHLPSHVTLKLR